MNTQQSNDADRKPEYLAFALGAEQYAVDIQQVQEIRNHDTVTRIANASEHVRGVINLRGQIVPIVDLRIRFGLSDVSLNEQNVVIILSFDDTVTGIIVDSVSDVVEIAAGDIKEPPLLSSRLGTYHISGIATLDDRMLIILDIVQLLTAEDLVAGEDMVIG